LKFTCKERGGRSRTITALIVCAAQCAMALHAHTPDGSSPTSPRLASATTAPTAIHSFTSDAALPESLHTSDTYRLWTGRAPGAKGDSPSETPTLTWFAPPLGRANGTAVIIAPGGAYVGLAGVLEGTEPASWFASRGITAFVLQYRVGKGARLPTPLFDGARAVRFVRAHAAEFYVDPTRIGMMGFSAGGHLAATTAVQASVGAKDATDPVERESGRPDFLILGYPWLEGMQLLPDGHSQYCDFAIRATQQRCNPQDYVHFAPTDSVTSKAPPTFIYHTSDDELVPAEGSLRFYAALRRQNVPVEMHLFEHGPHGTGLGGSDPALSAWPQFLQDWLRHRGLLPAP
jgi:acetyl esterase/lipase